MKNWGQPFAALLGSIYVQKGFGLPAIGGKDSMSGSFEDLHVPPTLISFAVQVEKANKILSPEFKAPEHREHPLHTKNDLASAEEINRLRLHTHCWSTTRM